MYIGRNNHRISFACIKQGIVHKGSHCFKQLSKVYSRHALTLHACAVVELHRHEKKNEAEFIPRACPSESPSEKSLTGS